MATDPSTSINGRAGIFPPAGMDVEGTVVTVEPAHGFSNASSAGSIHNVHILVATCDEQRRRPFLTVHVELGAVIVFQRDLKAIHRRDGGLVRDAIDDVCTIAHHDHTAGRGIHLDTRESMEGRRAQHVGR